MKNILFVLIAVAGGMLGAYTFKNVVEPLFGATTARTTITNPWTFSATTTLSKPLIVTTTNTATSTVQIGCIQTTATSTATPVRLVVGSIATTSTSYDDISTVGLIGWRYGTCPNLP